MIAWPQTQAEFDWGRDFLLERQICITPDSHMLFWVRNGKPIWVIAFNSWVGLTCQIHIANDKSGVHLPREFIRAGFYYAFVIIKRKYVFGTVNGNNKAALRLNTWLGFEEIHRLPDANKDGGDMVFMQMARKDCRWLKENVRERHTAST